ncbi:bis(5'-nucleosyl)-tetraphosphatase [Aliidiomarina minuta]|uniref:bis(5'-nucleosyl)-tetraphosphatase (symmetrical) n=1 Tax=Aliidiomarina minuta TaxID=880057 RepID=A0A432W4A6_9GAMM|nr:symmetrical bis(5'-nucleosyl)-tetraphosphatase [Aliidiomarina minuta]RUO24299.1 bis(5'-nucleosyl)-tetraphosphatase [Aliidiomarina minuta]
MALYLVGDIHGCAREFEMLLSQVSFNPAHDQLWSVGDLIGRGPQPLEVLQLVDSLGSAFQCVSGNHDLNLLSVLCGVKPANPKDNTETILNSSQRHYWIDWLRQQPLMLQHPSAPLAMAHAGIYPGWSLHQAQQLADEASLVLQSEQFVPFLRDMYSNQPDTWDDGLQGSERFRFIVNAFTRMRFCRQQQQKVILDLDCKAPPAEAPETIKPWFKIWPESATTIAFGHWAALNGDSQRKDIVALDTGCVWGNKLTLWDYENNYYYQQDALAD